MEIQAEAGITMPEHPETSAAPARTERVHIPIFETKLLKVIRIEPADDDRIQALLRQAKAGDEASNIDSPSESSIIRRALRLGLDELERQRAQK